MDTEMDDRKVHVEHIHAQVRDARYEVDPEAIAEAILRRLLAGRSLQERRPGDDAA
jgi:anti-sigma28 factor (negative regulator of flagellin synthesis)